MNFADFVIMIIEVKLVGSLVSTTNKIRLNKHYMPETLDWLINREYAIVLRESEEGYIDKLTAKVFKSAEEYNEECNQVLSLFQL